jgi:hypothetical protein
VKPKELDYIENYIQLVGAVIELCWDRITISKHWEEKPTDRMIEIKRKILIEEKEWLESDVAKVWFRIYCSFGNCKHNKVHDNFIKKCTLSMKKLEKIANN